MSSLTVVAVMVAAVTGAATSSANQLDALVLLLLGGLLALGLPRITVRGRRRFWHGWVNSGLLPLLVGLAIGPTQLGWMSVEACQALRPLLGLALAAAGVLVGMQFRLAYLRSAGAVYLFKQSFGAVGQFLIAFIPLFGLALMILDWPTALSGAALVGMCAIASAQRPPLSTEERVPLREIVEGHVMPCGWWNALTLVGGSVVLSIGFTAVVETEQTIPHYVQLLATPLVLGLFCGWLTQRASNKDDLYLFLLAVLSLSGGLALAVDAVPLFFGLLVGVVLVNVANRKSKPLEGELEELEQPLAVGIGLLSGLCLTAVQITIWVWLLVPVLLLSRWLIRHRLSPSASTIGLPRDRRFAAPGAAGVVLVGCAVAAHDPVPMMILPLIAALAILTLVSDMVERRPLPPETVSDA